VQSGHKKPKKQRFKIHFKSHFSKLKSAIFGAKIQSFQRLGKKAKHNFGSKFQIFEKLGKSFGAKIQIS